MSRTYRRKSFKYIPRRWLIPKYEYHTDKYKPYDSGPLGSMKKESSKQCRSSSREQISKLFKLNDYEDFYFDNKTRTVTKWDYF